MSTLQLLQGKVTSTSLGPPRTATVEIDGNSISGVRLMDGVSVAADKGAWILDTGYGKMLLIGVYTLAGEDSPSTEMANHISDPDPHGQYQLEGEDLTLADGGRITWSNDDYITYDDASNEFRVYADGSASGATWRTGRLRLTANDGVSTSSTAHGLQVGDTTTFNIAIDGNEIMARNNGAAANLHLNAQGGKVTIGNGGVAFPTVLEVTAQLNAGDSILKLLEGSDLFGGGIQYNGVTNRLSLGTYDNSTTLVEALRVDRGFSNVDVMGDLDVVGGLVVGGEIDSLLAHIARALNIGDATSVTSISVTSGTMTVNLDFAMDLVIGDWIQIDGSTGNVYDGTWQVATVNTPGAATQFTVTGTGLGNGSDNPSPANCWTTTVSGNWLGNDVITGRHVIAGSITGDEINAASQVTIGTGTYKIKLLGGGGTATYFGVTDQPTPVYKNVNTPFYASADQKVSIGDKLWWDGSSLNVDGSAVVDGTLATSSLAVKANPGGRNRIINGDFQDTEYGSGLSWLTRQGADSSIVVDSANAKVGTNILKIPSGSGSAASVYSRAFPVEAGKKYRFSAWVQAPGTWTSGTWYGGFYAGNVRNADGSQRQGGALQTDYGFASNESKANISGGWYYRELVVTIAAGCTLASMTFLNYTDPNQQLWVNDVRCEEVVDTVLIEDGAITGPKVNATAQITVGTGTHKIKALGGSGTSTFLGITSAATPAYNNANTSFYAGADQRVSIGTKLTFDGTNLSVNGSVIAASGTIGGWTIGASQLSSTNIFLTSAGNIYHYDGAGGAGYNDPDSLWWLGADGKVSFGNKFRWDGSKIWIRDNTTVAWDSGVNIEDDSGTARVQISCNVGPSNEWHGLRIGGTYPLTIYANEDTQNAKIQALHSAGGGGVTMDFITFSGTEELHLDVGGAGGMDYQFKDSGVAIGDDFTNTGLGMIRAGAYSPTITGITLNTATSTTSYAISFFYNDVAVGSISTTSSGTSYNVT